MALNFLTASVSAENYAGAIMLIAIIVAIHHYVRKEKTNWY